MVLESLLNVLTTIAYGSISAYFIHRSVIGRSPHYVKFALSAHFAVVLLRTVVILFWQDTPAQWAHVHRVTAVMCMAAIIHEIGLCKEIHT